MDQQNYIFISYSENDREYADSLRLALIQKGFSIWMAPYNIPKGSAYRDVIDCALKNCSVFLPLLSEDYQKSVYASMEIERAAAYRKTIIPIKIGNNISSDALGFFMNSDHITAITDPNQNPAALQSVIAKIEKALSAKINSSSANEEQYSKTKASFSIPASMATAIPAATASMTTASAPLFGFIGGAIKKIKEKITAKQPTAKKPKLTEIEYSAIVPKALIKGAISEINVFLYEKDYEHIVEKAIQSSEGAAREVRGDALNIEESATVTVTLCSPDSEKIFESDTKAWGGRYLAFNFLPEIPDDCQSNQIRFTASVYFNGIIASTLKFVANCSLGSQQIKLARSDITSAFISYASPDREQVVDILQGMRKARPDMDIFFDRESLKSGDNWETRIINEISRRDILFLCWSESAKASEWVEKEWRYALNNKGIESIEPIPLISPDKCPPPDELKSKHFFDKELMYRSNMIIG